MHDRQRRVKERGQRVRVHMSAREDDFPIGSKGFILAGSLEGLLAEADALDVARADSKRKRKQGTEARDGARKSLRRMLKTTYDTAEPLTLDHPEVKGVFKPPSRSNNDQALVVEARSAANAAAPFAALFTESGLPPAFFDEMRSKADDIEISASTQTEAVDEGVAKTAALADIFRRMDDVVERLDPIVRNKYRNDPAKLAAWESASRVESAPRHDDDDDNTDNNTPPPPSPPANP
jgi:hypothetical protein